MRDIVLKLLSASIACDMAGDWRMAQLLTDAIKEIENARHIRGATDEGAKQSGDANERAGTRNRD
jgi:hypothetical protein